MGFDFPKPRYVLGVLTAAVLGLLSIGVFLVVVGAAYFSGNRALIAVLALLMVVVMAFNVSQYWKQL